MGEKFRPNFDQIDDLLNEIGQSTDGKRLLAEIDNLCNEVDDALDTRKVEVEQWSVERKRLEAMDSSDPFVLNLLSMDENFNVRTLSACNPNIPVNSLRRLAEGANDYVRMIIANNPACTPEILDRISELSGEQEVLDTVKINPNASVVTKYKIGNRAADLHMSSNDVVE